MHSYFISKLLEFYCTGTYHGSGIKGNIIFEGFRPSEEMHSLRYLWLNRDGDSCVYHSVVTGVLSYGRDIIKMECTNHAVKCYRNQLEALCNEKSRLS